MKRICVFCGSSSGKNPIYTQQARLLGKALVESGLELVYGGASIGLMGEIANSVIEAGGVVTGVITQGLLKREIANPEIQDLRIVETMHQRKALMESLSDGFIAMPGGFGTLDELCEIVTWFQLGIHKKPFALLNAAGYFDPFVQFIDRGVGEGFILESHRVRLKVETDPARILKDFLQMS